jgi:hypothetical protein
MQKGGWTPIAASIYMTIFFFISVVLQPKSGLDCLLFFRFLAYTQVDTHAQ